MTAGELKTDPAMLERIGGLVAEAIARVRIGLDTVTRPAWAASSSAIAHLIAVDSHTTWSSGPNDSANTRSRPVAIRPNRRSPPFACTATSAKRLCTSSAMVLTTPRPLSSMNNDLARGGRATRHLRIRARQAQPDKSKGRPDISAGSTAHMRGGLPSA